MQQVTLFIFVLISANLSAQRGKTAFSLDRSVGEVFRYHSLSQVLPDSLEPQGDFQFEEFTLSIKASPEKDAIVLTNKSDHFMGLCRQGIMSSRLRRGGELVFQDIYYRRSGDTQLRKYPSFVVRITNY